MILLIDNITNYKNSDFEKRKNYIEKEKFLKIKNETYRKETLLGRKLLKDGLENYSIVYQPNEIKYNEFGKPYLNNHNDIFFNISHSHEYVVCAIDQKEIGIDIEKIREIPIEVMNQFATTKEKAFILENKNNRYERLFTIYTLKEAYFKMLGTDLKNILKVEFVVSNNKVSCSDQSIIAEIKKNDDYVIAICKKKE